MKYTFVIAALLYTTTQAIRINAYEEPAAEAPPAPVAEAAPAKSEEVKEEKTEAKEEAKEEDKSEKKGAAGKQEAKEGEEKAVAPKAEKNATPKADPALDKKNAAKEKEATEGAVIPKISPCTHPNNADCKIDTESASSKPTPAEMRQKEVYKVFDHGVKSNNPPLKKKPEVQKALDDEAKAAANADKSQ